MLAPLGYPIFGLTCYHFRFGYGVVLNVIVSPKGYFNERMRKNCNSITKMRVVRK